MGKKLYIGNLPFTVDSDKLKEIFSEFGNVEEATVITDKFSRRSKGFGFVTFENDADADKALEGMNGKEVEGRSIKVSEAKPMEERPEGGRSFGNRNFGDRGGNRNFGNRDRQRRF
ncbi:MAG: RNA-binding protein [Nanoarchaeota archaeon]